MHRGVEEARNSEFALVPVGNYPAASKQGKRLMKYKLRKFNKDTDDCATRPWGRLCWLEPFPQIKACKDDAGVMKAKWYKAVCASHGRG